MYTPAATLQIREDAADDSTDAAEAAGGCENPIRFKRKNKMVFFPRAMKKKKKKLQIDESET